MIEPSKSELDYFCCVARAFMAALQVIIIAFTNYILEMEVSKKDTILLHMIL